MESLAVSGLFCRTTVNQGNRKVGAIGFACVKPTAEM